MGLGAEWSGVQRHAGGQLRDEPNAKGIQHSVSQGHEFELPFGPNIVNRSLEQVQLEHLLPRCQDGSGLDAILHRASLRQLNILQTAEVQTLNRRPPEAGAFRVVENRVVQRSDEHAHLRGQHATARR